MGPPGEQGPAGPIGKPGLDYTPAVYVGRDACKECHTDLHTSYLGTGHAWALNKIVDGKAPQYPESEVPDPPAGYTWDDILYVIGGYGWMARFVDKQGMLVTGEISATTQYNFENRTLDTEAGWVSFHAGEQLADLRPRQEQVERPGERVGAAVAVGRARCEVVVVAAQEVPEQRLRVGPGRGGHRRAADRRGAHSVGATTSGASAARMDGGTGVGRCVARSTQTWTKRPLAAGASSPWRKMPIS